jgi:NAD(P)-dependent dehydrogenase (short-subunit alcohol dehydrogenase family)
MKIAGSAVLVTGANRGLGRALAEETLRRGAKRVYAGTRKLFAHSDARYISCVGGDQRFTDPAGSRSQYLFQARKRSGMC